MYPRLLHAVPVKIRKIDRKFTAVLDPNLKEPIGQVRRPQKPVELQAQVKIMDTDKPIAAEGGAEEQSDGYLLFRTKDLRAAEVSIERGDRVIQIGEGDNAREVDYYITKFRWRGHYQRAGGPTLLKAYFMDRHPANQQGDL